MDAAADTPVGTPTKCGCAGGIVVSCGAANPTRGRPSPTAKRRFRVMPRPECPMCAEEAMINSQYCVAKCVALKGTLTEGKVSEDSTSDIGGPGRERRSYASLLRGALGRWSGKRKRIGRCREAGRNHASPNNYSQVPNSCTNNNCESPDRCKLNRSTQAEERLAHPAAIKDAPRLDSAHPTPTEMERRQTKGKEGHRENGNNPGKQLIPETGRKSELSTTPAASTQAGQRLHRTNNGSACNKNAQTPDSEDRHGCKKLPDLPYREDGSQLKPSVMGAAENGKRRRGKRKYFSSPIHRKEPNRDGEDVQSTYVSFQDEFAKDVYLNVDRSPPTSTTPNRPARRPAWSRLTRRKRNDSDLSSAEVSPTTPSDDVFADSPNSDSRVPEIANQINGQQDHDEEALIEKLFHKVNAAFGPSGAKRTYSEGSSRVPDYHPSRNRHFTYHEENAQRCRADMRPGTSRWAPCKIAAVSNTHHEPIEAIMASANLHASLDNAMCMLNESTKLLSPLDQSGLQHPEFASRHGDIFGGNMFLASHQQIRARTYSTCSRLETIAEENDRTEDSTPDLDRKYAEDVTSCTLSDTSEYEKPMIHRGLRTDSDSMFSGATKHSFESDFSSMSLQRPHTANLMGMSARDPTPGDEYDQKTRLLLRSCPNSTIRRQSTSTISVRGLQKDHNEASTDVVRQVFGPTAAEKCVACEWARTSQFKFPAVPAIPSSAWSQIVHSGHQCQDRSHIHPWGVCTERHAPPPVLCHSHYLQYYQYLQNNPKPGRARRQPLRSASSQGDSLIDYDINEVISSLDELVMSDPSSAHSSSTNIYRSHCQHLIGDHLLGHDDHRITRSEANFSSHYLDVRQYNKQQVHKQSDTDVSVNSDSAFSTNGSLTPSTRDGVNTDRDSIDSMTEAHNMEQHLNAGSKVGQKLSSHQTPGRVSSEDFHFNTRSEDIDCDHNQSRFTATHISRGEFQHSWVSARGQRTQSYEEGKPHKSLLTATDLSHCHDKRYSVVSSVGSSSSPLASDQLCDSAVHLQDNSSSRSVQLSSESFYSTGTSHGDKDTCLLDRALSLNSISRSSSEASLNSEGTLCLSDYAMSQQNISLSCAQSFPQIHEICSPTDMGRDCRFVDECNSREITQDNPFTDWGDKTEVTERIRAFMNPSRPQDFGVPGKGFFDTLASSSGSSDSNTLGSGSSGSTYASSSLRSYMSNSRFNTFDSSSCVSTDDTGETVIDQHTLRQNGRLHDIVELPSPGGIKVRRKRSNNDDKKRYRASAFHYENLDMPQYIEDHEDVIPRTEEISDAFEVAVTKDVTRNMHIQVSRTRSSSLSCIMSSVTRVSCIVRQCKSLSDVQGCDLSACFEEVEYSESNAVFPVETEKDQSELISGKPFNPKTVILQTEVDSMIQHCSDFDNIISSLRESLRYHTPSEESLDQKLLELGEILKQKDEVINQLHRMLLTSYSYSNSPLKYSNANATI